MIDAENQLVHDRERHSDSRELAELASPSGMAVARECCLAYFGVNEVESPDFHKVATGLLVKLQVDTSAWQAAQQDEISSISDSAWAANFVRRHTMPSVLSLVQVEDIGDEAAESLLRAALADDPDGRLFGGTHGTFVAKLSFSGIRSVAKLSCVHSIS